MLVVSTWKFILILFMSISVHSAKCERATSSVLAIKARFTNVYIMKLILQLGSDDKCMEFSYEHSGTFDCSKLYQ